MKPIRLVQSCIFLAVIACSGQSPAAPATSSTPAAAIGGTSAPPPSAGTDATATVSMPAEAERPFVMPPVPAGFQRFITPPIDVPGGSSNDWMQWVGGPTDADYDVVAIQGAQSQIGHHALMLATTEAHPVGFTRVWNERDQLSSRTMGGIGAEGAVPVPDGVVIRIKKGTYFAVQTHYLNAATRMRSGQTYVDVKLGAPDPSHKLASSFASTSLSLSIAAHAQSTVDLHCKTGKDLSILRMTNHMHHYGVSTFTEYTDPSGKTQMLKQDMVWSEDWALSPNFDYFPVDKPLLLPAGSTLHTRCTWDNPTAQPITFPTEMCVFATLVLGENDISCIDGNFRESNSEPVAPAAMSSMPTSASGACTTAADEAILQASDYVEQMKTCGTSCLGGTDTCATEWLTKNTSLTPPCAACEGTRITCAMANCIADCAGGFMSPSCSSCIESHCGSVYHACAGL